MSTTTAPSGNVELKLLSLNLMSLAGVVTGVSSDAQELASGSYCRPWLYPLSESDSLFRCARLIKAQDDAAATMFFYHLNGMGYDPWEHREPRYSEDPCVQAVWRMTCYTYFPQSQAGCASGQQ
eukprot:3631573-Amphidinium_carterae.1